MKRDDDWSPLDLDEAKKTNKTAEEIVQALYDRLGLTHSIVTVIAMMAILLHARAKQRGGSRQAYTEEVRRVAEGLANAPDGYADMINLHGYPDADTSKKPN